MKTEVIKIMLRWVEYNEPIEIIADKLLDLFNVSNPLPDCPHCKSKMNIITHNYSCPKCHCHLRG
jgi:transposase-like protein